MKKKYMALATGIFAFSLMFLGTTCHAAEEYKIWNSDKVLSVDKNKNWKITFNKDINLDSAKNSIKIYKKDNNESLDIKFLNSKGNVVEVSPQSSYEEGKDYVLTIDQDLKSAEGKSLKEPVKYNFKVKEDSIQPEQQNDKTQSENVINSYEEYYNCIKKALTNYESTLVLTINNYDKDIYNLDVINKVVIDYPNLRSGYTGATGTVQYSKPVQLTIKFKYNDTKENLIKKEKMVQQKVSQIISTTVKADMKDYEKELALHDYVVNNAKYDQRLFSGNMPDESYTAYGVLINGTGVCQGYAEAMNRLLQAVGIESRMVVGEANNGSEWIGHAWNIVKIGGKYYHVDATWDDPVMNDGSNRLMHSYFNITDNEIGKNHKWNREDYPKCNSTEHSFDNLNVLEKDANGNVITVVKSYDEFYNAIDQALTERKSTVSVKIQNYDPNVYSVTSAVRKAYKHRSGYGSYKWSHYSDEISGAEYIIITFN